MSSATTGFSRIKTHFCNWREWELNPVVVKELRQSVRSWAVTGMLLLFLAVLFCTALGFLISQSFDVTVNQRLGSNIFQAFTAILTGASLLFIPFYVGVRLAAERQDSNLDLLYISTLTPARIIRGKFFCGAYMTVLFFSACMPFMAFTNLLRGVDLPTVVFVLGYLFLVVCVAIQVAIFVACLPISKLFKVLLGLFGMGTMVPTVVGLTVSFYTMMRSGVGSMMGGSSFWSGFFTALALILAAVILLHLLSIALISPLSANRALPLRSYLAAIWIFGGLGCGIWAFKVKTIGIMSAWEVVTLIFLALAVVNVISNHDQLSLRVRRDIPANPLKRFLAFLFYNGAAGGLVWIGLIAAITYGISAGMMHWVPEHFPGFSGIPTFMDEFDTMVPSLVLYGFAYALTALFIHRKFFNRRPPKLAGVIAILLPALWALIPTIVLFFANRLSFREMEHIQLGNIFNVFMVKEYSQRLSHLICAGIWFAVALVLNLKWFSQQRKEFVPLEKYTGPKAAPLNAVPPRLPAETRVLEG